jgi:tetratricopeptide (TPR) repeat protein
VQDVQTRVFATFGQPNWLAAYLIMLIPLTGWLTLQTWTQRRQPHQWWWLGLWITCLVADIVTVLFTGSRSGFLGLLLSGLILALGGGWLMWKQVEQRRFLLTAGISAALLTGVIFIWCGTPFTPKFSQLWSKYSTHLAAGVASSSALTTGAPTTPTSLPANAAPAANTVLENGGTDSGNIRRIVWKGALAIWRAYPILGSGVETFAYSYYRFRPIEHNMVSEWDFLYNKAHNEFLNTLATTGAIGLLSLLLIMTVTTLILGWPTIQTALHPQTSSADHDLSWWLLPWCLLAGYAALAVSNFFGFSTVMVAVLFYLFPAFWVVYQQKTITSVNKKLIPAAPAHVALLKVSSHTAPTSHSAIKPPAAAAAALETETSAAAWIGYGLVALTVGWCLWSVLGMWDSDRRFANAQALANQSQLPAAYQELTTLVRQAPSEPTYWQEYGLDTAKLAAALQPSDASLAAQLIEPALLGSQRAITLSPANINSWKWRIRTLFYLGQLDSKYLTIATDALLQARRLAPRDPKLALNLALVYQQRQLPTEATQAFVEALQLKPDYELARNSYGPFLEEQGDLAGALEQYRYVVEKLKPGEAFATGRIADLTARLATSSARPR